MKKTYLSLVVAGFVAAPMAVMAEAIIYGRAHLSLDDVTGYAPITTAPFSYKDSSNGDDKWTARVVSRASRLGFKGSEDLGGGLKAIYKMEFGVQMADGNNNVLGESGNSVIAGRNMYAGLAGDWGTFLMGRHDTPTKVSTTNLDMFGDRLGDYKDTAGFVDLRVDTAVAYISPSMSGFTGALALVAPAWAQAGNPDANGFNAVSLAGMYQNGPFYGTVSYQQIGKDMLMTKAVANNNGSDWETWRAALSYSDYGFTLTGMWENDSNWGAVKKNDSDIYSIQGSYAFGANVVKVMGGWRQNDAKILKDGDSYALGYDYNLSKRSTLYAVYNNTSNYYGLNSPVGSNSQADYRGVSFGIIHNF